MRVNHPELLVSTLLPPVANNGATAGVADDSDVVLDEVGKGKYSFPHIRPAKRSTRLAGFGDGPSAGTACVQCLDGLCRKEPFSRRRDKRKLNMENKVEIPYIPTLSASQDESAMRLLSCVSAPALPIVHVQSRALVTAAESKSRVPEPALLTSVVLTLLQASSTPDATCSSVTSASRLA